MVSDADSRISKQSAHHRVLYVLNDQEIKLKKKKTVTNVLLVLFKFHCLLLISYVKALVSNIQTGPFNLVRLIHFESERLTTC